MRNKLFISFVILTLLPFGTLLAQKRDTTLAILDNKLQSQLILNDLYAEQKSHNKILVLYQDQFYSLADFDFLDVLSKNDLDIAVHTNPDAIQRIVEKQDIKAVIVLSKKLSARHRLKMLPKP